MAVEHTALVEHIAEAVERIASMAIECTVKVVEQVARLLDS